MKTKNNKNSGIEILIAEDSPTQAEKLQYLLEEHGYTVTTAPDGKQALAAARQRKPALIVSDVMMPEMDGFTLCGEIKRDDQLQDVPVMLLTTLSDVGDIMKGLQCGANNFIRKPYEERYLLARIDHLLMNNELRRHQKMQMGVEINLGGQKHFITAERQQIVDLLISVYEEAVHIGEELKARQRELADSNSALRGLYHVAKGLNHAVSEREVCDVVLEHAMGLPGVQAGWIFLGDKDTFRTAVVRNLPPALLGEGAMEGLCECRRRFLAGELDQVTNIMGCERLKRAASDINELRFHASVPLWSGDRNLGIMNLVGADQGLFNDDELETLNGVGHQVGIALERVWLHEHLENIIEEKTASLRLFRALLDNSNDAIEVLDPVTFQFLDINETAHLALDYSREELLSMNVFDIDPSVSAESIKMLKSQLSKSGPTLLETLHRRKDGSTFPVEISLTSTELDKPYVLAIVRDITERKEQESKINRLNRIHNLLSGINTTIVRIHERQQLFDEACRIAVEQGQFIFAWIGTFDAGTQRITPVAMAGREDGYLSRIDHTVTENTQEDCRLPVRALTQGKPAICNNIATDKVMQSSRAEALLRGYRSVAVFPLQQGDRPAGVFVLYASEVNFFDAEEMVLLVQMAGDISFALDHLKAESDLRRLNEELEEKVAARTADLEQARLEADRANRAKSAFLAAMSHEIRTPMNGVIGMVDVLHQTSLKGHQVEMVDLIRESAFSLLDIIEDILDFSKIEAGKLEIECAPLTLVEVVEKTCDLLDHLAAKKGVEFTLFVDPAIPEEVLGDALRLRQVLVNLANNAIKFSSGQQQPGRVSVRAILAKAGLAGHGQERVTVEFQVADNGIGMDEATQARLFTAFTQADASITRRFGGTGLGLTISRRLVNMMDGEITVRSASGKGATFSVRIPFTPLPAKPTEGGKFVDLSGLSCLVLGEPEGLADDLAAYLTYGGALVERAPDLDTARKLIGTVPPGLWLIIIDAGYDTPPIEELRAACHARRNLDPSFVAVKQMQHQLGMEPRFVVIRRGRRRQGRTQTVDLVTLDSDVMHRRFFLQAVATAAGRMQEEEETPLPDKVKAIGPLSRAEALRQNRLILVAEDNETNQKVILHQLGLFGYTADVASDGRAALSRWESGDYALLLTDLHMPEMDGYDLSLAIRRGEAGKRRIPIIALTANALKSEAERCRAAGMDDYLSKPAQLADLKIMLEKWLPQANSSILPAGTLDEIHARATSVVDVMVLQGLVGDDADTVRQFLADYRASARCFADEMHAAIAAGDARHAGAIAHKLKSSSRSVGALALGDLCAGLEKFGTTGNKTAIVRGMAGFDAALAKVEAEIAKLLTE